MIKHLENFLRDKDSTLFLLFIIFFTVDGQDSKNTKRELFLITWYLIYAYKDRGSNVLLYIITGKESECLSPYKFSLAFENSLCRDYVTEKFWRILNETLSIPIVMGGADYKALAPPDSYLDVTNFTSPKVDQTA